MMLMRTASVRWLDSSFVALQMFTFLQGTPSLSDKRSPIQTEKLHPVWAPGQLGAIA